RYPDVLVHRSLAALIEGKQKPPLDVEATEAICNVCNDINKNMREADKACGLAVLNIYLRRQKEAMDTIGVVLSVDEHSLSVFLPEVDSEIVRETGIK
ncbi:hypothetical protein ENH_00001150, partial [Eimeria necatrix]